MASFKLRISIPNKVCVQQNVTQATFFTALGQATFLPNHAPIIGAVTPGYIQYKIDNGSIHTGLLNHGVYTFKNNELIILSDFFEHSCNGIDENAIAAIDEKIQEETKKLALSQKATKSLSSFMRLISTKAKGANKKK